MARRSQREPPRLGPAHAAPGNDIDRIEVHGDPAAALMLKLCYSRGASHVNKSSFYRGSFTLDPRAALGCNKAYLYVQTVNDVAPGTNALAAQTIGGLAAGQNLTTQPSASGGCAFCMVLDYTFHVIVPPPAGAQVSSSSATALSAASTVESYDASALPQHSEKDRDAPVASGISGQRADPLASDARVSTVRKGV